MSDYAPPLQTPPTMQLSSVRRAHQVGAILSWSTALHLAVLHYDLQIVKMPENCLQAGLKIADLPEDDIADKKRKQRGARRQSIPTDFCGPIQTPAEEALYWQLYQDSACQNRDGSDNFLFMAGRFNQHWSTQVSCIPEHIHIHCWLTCAVDVVLASNEVSIIG